MSTVPQVGRVIPIRRPELLVFSAIYKEWFRTVYRWVRALGGPQSDAEDWTQEVFVVVQRRLPDFDGQNLAGWLYRIAANTVSDQRRRAWFRNIFMRPRDVELESFGGEGDIVRRQEQADFYRLVEKMNKKWRNTFVLFEVMGHSGEEIADLENLPPATVRTHLHRARKEFLALLAEET